MRTDMSPAAITARLKTLDELWELSVKLMRAKAPESETALLAEKSLVEDWNSPEEAAAWRHLAELKEK